MWCENKQVFGGFFSSLSLSLSFRSTLLCLFWMCGSDASFINTPNDFLDLILAFCCGREASPSQTCVCVCIFSVAKVICDEVYSNIAFYSLSFSWWKTNDANGFVFYCNQIENICPVMSTEKWQKSSQNLHSIQLQAITTMIYDHTNFQKAAWRKKNICSFCLSQAKNK